MSYLSDALSALTACLTCFSAPTIRVGAHKFKILKLLGEGGFSYVYLVQDTASRKLVALKKVRCAFGKESLDVAKREIENYKLFRSEYIIRLLDSDIVQESDGTKTVYMVLPYFERGNLQDKINDNILCGTTLQESEVKGLVIEICRAIKELHHYRNSGSSSNRGDSRYSMETGGLPSSSSTGQLDADNFDIGSDEDDDDDNNSNDLSRSATPSPNEEEQRLLGSVGSSRADLPGAVGQEIPYAHRDIKPANIMIGHKGRPVLMDFGSCAPARITVSTRQQALELQDLAAEHCTLPYRAPELFDVKTGISVDERVDVWSLGCTIFALMYGVSPFEQQQNETGASLNMAILSGQYKFPASPPYSSELKELVSKCLTVDASIRPFIDEIQDLAEML